MEESGARRGYRFGAAHRARQLSRERIWDRVRTVREASARSLLSSSRLTAVADLQQ